MTDEQTEAMAGQKPPLIRSFAPEAWSNATGTEVGENIPEQGQDGEGLEKWIDYVPAQRGELVAPAPAEEYLHEEVIFGKPYRIWPGPKDGTYVVSWGDQSFLWEPKPWQPESLQKAGPIMYERVTHIGRLLKPLCGGGKRRSPLLERIDELLVFLQCEPVGHAGDVIGDDPGKRAATLMPSQGVWG